MSNALFENVYNPDVLSCLANLSNDEVFTPPDVVNKMLDMLPQELFRNPDTTFLDPACKTGVFLREIAKRLIIGLEAQIPDLQERVDHIFHKQLYGIAITELTSLLSRRGVYCSKYPNSEFSVSRFDDAQGNIRYKRIPHTWGKTTYDSNGKPKASCIWCGASKSEYDRSAELETHAYEWIHTQNPEEIFKMKFDVIIGNPPYQLSTGGGSAQATPLYNKFVEQAKKLKPRYLSMIIPSRWFAGGMGLDKFRTSMLDDGHITKLVDFPNAKDCFSQSSIGGGVCYFLWERDSTGLCQVTNVLSQKSNTLERKLNEYDVFVRYNSAITIIRKIPVTEKRFSLLCSSLSPFGINSSERGNERYFPYAYTLYSSKGIGYVQRSVVTAGFGYIDKYKILISKTSAEHAGEPDSNGTFKVLSKISPLGPDEICTFSYFVAGPFNTKRELENAITYLKTKFARFLILQAVTSINLSKDKFQFVPMQDFSKPWTDAELYTKYNLTQEEIDFIESMIKPMDSTNIKED